MADNFLDKQEEVEEPEATEEVVEEEATSTFKIGEKEYAQEDLERLVGLGEMAREAEEKYNTPMDRVYPEYTKKSQRVKELEAEIEQQRQAGDITSDQAEEALKAARSIGIMTKDSLKEDIRGAFAELYAEQRAVDKLLDTTSSLEKQINGEDGRPAFKQEEILNYMNETGISDPELAYKAKYEKKLDAWKESALAGKTPKANTLDSSTAGSKAPKPVAVTNDNLNELMSEALNRD